MHYVVLCYIPHNTGGIHGEVYLSMLHLPGYCWCVWCTTSPMVLVVNIVYFLVLCYIAQDTGGVFGVLHCSMLHPQGTGGVYGILHSSMLHPHWYLWYRLCTKSFYVTSPWYMLCIWFITSFYVTSFRVIVVYMVYYIVLHVYYIPQGFWWCNGVLYCSMLHPPGYWSYISSTTSLYDKSPKSACGIMVYYIVLCFN